jgi:hypothetical protein
MSERVTHYFQVRVGSPDFPDGLAELLVGGGLLLPRREESSLPS